MHIITWVHMSSRDRNLKFLVNWCNMKARPEPYRWPMPRGVPDQRRAKPQEAYWGRSTRPKPCFFTPKNKCSSISSQLRRARETAAGFLSAKEVDILLNVPDAESSQMLHMEIIELLWGGEGGGLTA